MKIILKEDISNLGYKDDIVTVKDGYGRNYLIPQGKAVIANPSNLKQLEENQRQRAHKLAQIKAEAEAIRDEIKQELLNRDTEELEAGQYIVRWTSVLSQRFDTTALKKFMPEIYKAYTKQVSSRRFSISA